MKTTIGFALFIVLLAATSMSPAIAKSNYYETVTLQCTCTVKVHKTAASTVPPNSNWRTLENPAGVVIPADYFVYVPPGGSATITYPNGVTKTLNGRGTYHLQYLKKARTSQVAKASKFAAALGTARALQELNKTGKRVNDSSMSKE